LEFLIILFFLDLVNDESLRKNVEKYQNSLKNKVAKDIIEHSKEELKEDAASHSEEVQKDAKVELEDSGSDIKMSLF
jgi:hypothetical protein